MRIWVFFLLISCLVGMGTSWWLQTDSGYVLLTWNGYTFETSVWFFCLVIAACSLVVYWAVRLLLLLIGRDGSFKKWRNQRRALRAKRYTTRGMLCMAQGNWPRAERLLGRGAKYSETPLINYLEAARAANAQGKHGAADHWLKEASSTTKGADLAVGLTQIELLFQRGHIEQALATTSTLRTHHLHHPELLAYQMKAYQQLEDWVGLRDILPSVKKAEALSKHDIDDIEHKVCLQLLERTVKAHSINRTNELMKTFEHLPKYGKQSPEVVACYVQLLIEQKAHTQAEDALRAALKTLWSDELITLYGSVKGQDPKKQFLFAKQQLKARTNDAALLLTLGKLANAAGDYTQAREYLTCALKVKPSREAHIEMGRSLALDGNEISACEHFLKASQ